MVFEYFLTYVAYINIQLIILSVDINILAECMANEQLDITTEKHYTADSGDVMSI